MLCPVDIKIKTSSHRERLVVREVWEQSRRRRRGDLQSPRFRSQRRMICSKRDGEDRRSPAGLFHNSKRRERNGGDGRGGDEEDIRKKKEFGHSMAFYLFLLSLCLSPARSLPLSPPPPLPVSPLELRGLHMEVSKRKASPSGQIFSLPRGHVVYRNAVKSLAWQAP